MKLRHTISVIAVALSLAFPPLSHAQGCALCRDNMSTTQPATQRAFRHSIEFISGSAFAFFAATLAIAWRFR